MCNGVIIAIEIIWVDSALGIIIVDHNLDFHQGQI